MLYRRLGIASMVASLWVAVVLCCGSLRAQGDGPPADDGTPPVRAYGSASLTPPTDATNQDATGFVKLRQWGERLALHVYVRHLEPGATYDVVATKEGADPEALGTITTHDGTPPPPSCFRATLAPPPPADGGEGAWFGHGDGDHWGMDMTAGFAVFYRNREGTQLYYMIYVRGLTGDPSLQIEGMEPIALPVGDHHGGAIDVTADQLAALADGKGTLVATSTLGDGTTVDLSGAVEPCMPDGFRDRMAQHLAGTGALRLDTENGDTMPFGATAVADLVGVTVEVKDAEGAVVLAGTITDTDVHQCTPRPPPGSDDPGPPPADEGDALGLAGEAAFFEVPEIHDAGFVRGDVNGDGIVDISDPVSTLMFLFSGGTGAYCTDAADADDNGTVDVSDPVLVLSTLFQGSASIAAPYPDRGFDTTADELFCGATGN